MRRDLVAQEHERVRQIFGGPLAQPNCHRVQGVHPEAPLVLFVAQGVWWLVRGTDSARTEDELEARSLLRGVDHARRETRAGLRSLLLAVEEDLVLECIPRFEP